MDRCPVTAVLTSMIWLSMLMKADCKQSQASTGSCELYTGSSCKDYLKGKYVFVKRGENQNVLEERISKWFQTAQSMNGVSDQCWPHAKILICFHTFPTCDSAKKLPANRRFCQDECKFLEQYVCRQEFLLAKSISAIKQFVPSCGTLPQPGSLAHSECLKLPSLNESKFPRKPIVAHTVNTIGVAKDRAALKCFFKVYRYGHRSQDVIVRWYKNGTALDMRMKRFRIKRRHRGDFLLISTLIVKQVTYEDAGHYDCIAIQGKASVKSGANLSVVEGTKEDKREEVGGEIPDTTDNNDVSYGNGLGRCTPYRGKVCAKYLSGEGRNTIFEYSYSPQNLVEKQLVREFSKFKESKQFSKRCLEMSLAVMCFNVFNTCNKSAVTPASRLCHGDCHLFDKVHCKYEAEMARKHSSAFEFLPDCTLLPEKNKLCEPMHGFVFGINANQANGTKCYEGEGKDYDGKMNVSKTGRPCKSWIKHSSVYKFTHNYCRNFGGENYSPWCFVANGEKEFCNIPKCEKQTTDSKNNRTAIKQQEPYTSCFYGRGEDYRGQVKVSVSGKQCLQWSFIGSYEARHSYCRNYNGLREGPWCYTSQERKEYCDIPKCVLTSKNDENSSPSLVYYVVPVAIALSVLLLVVLVLLVYLKQRRKGDPAGATSAQVQNGSMLVVGTARLNKESIGKPRVSGPLDKVPEVNDCSVNFLEMIGKGFFMELWKAELMEVDQNVTPLLVKRLSPDATKSLVNAFSLEISTVRGLDHPNIPELLCVSRQGIVPFLGYGGDSERDLKTCLINSRKNKGAENRLKTVDFDVIIDMAVQVANGLAYLHENNIIHKDVGTRSCLIDTEGTVQIAHFGIGLYLYPGDYFHDNYMTLPARWMSPETLQTKSFTKSNDVWSLGILLWELFSYAEKPYGDMSDKEAMNCIANGQLLLCPDDCPASLYALMKDCWIMNSSERILLGEAIKRLNSWNGTVC